MLDDSGGYCWESYERTTPTATVSPTAAVSPTATATVCPLEQLKTAPATATAETESATATTETVLEEQERLVGE